MGHPPPRVPPLRRAVAALLSLLCACEAGVLPASAAVARESAPASGIDVLRDAVSGAGWAPASALQAGPAAAPAATPAARTGAAASLPALLASGGTAGDLRGAGRALVSEAPDARRARVAAWVSGRLNAPLAELADGAAVPTPILAEVRATLPELLEAETPVLPPSASPAAIRVAQDAALRRIARLGLPDFAPKAFIPPPGEVPAAAVRPQVPAAAAGEADLRERLGEKQDMSGGAAAGGGALADFDKLAGRVEGELPPPSAGQATDRDAAQDADWASLEALKRMFASAGTSPDQPVPSGPPLPPDQEKAIDARVSRIEALKAELQADVAQRDAASAMAAVAEKARDAALQDRRSGKDDLEFRKNFSRLSMVMDLAYSLNLLNNADAALAAMQGLVAQKIAAIGQQQQAGASAGAAAGSQAGNTAAWTQQAQQSAASDTRQAASYAALGADVSGVAGAVTRFGSDVPALLAMIDARDKGASANAIAEYNRRLALLPSIDQQLKTGASSASSGVTSLSLSYLQSQLAEVNGDLNLLAGADAKISAVPVEFAGALVVAVPGVPSETVTNPTQAQMLALLSRRQAFWKSQYDQEASLLASIQQAMDPSNTATAPDSFGSQQPVSLVVWKNQEVALDDRLAAAEAPMLAQADADEAVIESAGGGASLPRLSSQSPGSLRTSLPQLLTQLQSLALPDTDAGFAAKAAYIDLARLVCFLGDATAQRLQAEATSAALDQPVNVLLPKARDAFSKAVTAWQAVLTDVAADVSYVNAGAPPAQNQALIARKQALVDSQIAPALKSLQDLLANSLIPYQNTSIAQSDPSNTGDGYQTLYTQKIALYQQISDGYTQTLPWALASDGAPPYSVGAADAGISNLRKTYDSNLATVVSNQQTIAQATDPNGTATEVVYGESMPVSLVKRMAVYQAEKNSRAASMNADAAQINAMLAQMDALGGGKTNLASTWKLPTSLDPASPNTAAQLNGMVSSGYLQNMAAAVQAVATAASSAGGPPSVSVGGGANVPTGTQPPLTVSNDQKIALLGLEAITRLVPSSQSGPADSSYAFCLARYLFSDALVSSSQVYLTQRIPLFSAYLASAKTALNAAEADLDADVAWVAGSRAGGPAVLTRKVAIFTSLASILSQGVSLFNQKAAWDGEGVASAVSATAYYNGLSSTYASGGQALAAELQAAQEFQAALAQSKSQIDSQRTEVLGWLQQLNNPNESALARVSENLSAIQDKTRTVLESNVQARAAEQARDKASAAMEAALNSLSAERSALDGQLNSVGDLSRLGPALAARTREAVGQDGAWIAEGPGGPQTLVIPKSQLGEFLSTLFGGLSSGQAAANVASLSANILKDPAALAQLIPGSKVVPVGQGPDGFYLVYQTEFSTPGGLATSDAATLGNIAKVWGQNVSVEGYRFESPPSLGNAPYGDQGVTVQLESLDSDHAVNYLDVTFHKFLQDIPTAGGVIGQAQEARMMVFDDFALLVDDGKVYFGALGFGDLATTGAAGQPQYYGGNLKASVKFTQVLSLNASQQVLLAKDPRKFLETVNLDFTGYDPSLNQNFLISGSGQNMDYERSQIGVGVDLGKALRDKNSFVLNLYYAHTSGNEDVNQSSLGATILKGFTFDIAGEKANVNVSAGGELGQVQNDANARISFELPNQGVAISAQGKLMGTGEAYYLEARKKLGDHSSAAVSYGSQYIGLNNQVTVSFSSSYTLGELWRAVTGQAAADLTGGRALADFDKRLADFFKRSKSDVAAAELKRVFDADVGRQMTSLAIGKLEREIETLTRAGAILDNTKQSAMVGFVTNPILPGTAEQATGGGFQVGTRTDLTLTKTQRALIESEAATIFSLGLDLEERLLDLTKAWQQALADIALARWRELLAGWTAAHADDPDLRAEAESDAAAAADDRRQAELRYASLTGRGPDQVPPFDGVNPQDFDALLAAVAASLRGTDRLGALIARARTSLDVPKAGFNVMDWVPWVEKLTFTVGATLPDTLDSQALGAGVTITVPVYDPSSGRNDKALRLRGEATVLEMSGRLRQTRLRAHGELLAAQAWAQRARGAQAQEDRLAAELSDGILQFRNGLIQPSELRERARRWRDAVTEGLRARTQASLESAWAGLDGTQGGFASRENTAEPVDVVDALNRAVTTAPDWEAMARRSEAARELLEASDRTVRKVDVDVTLGTNLTAAGVALLPAFGVTGLGAMPVVGVSLAPEELRQLDVRREGAEANLYTRLKDKAAADADLDATRAEIDASYLDRQIALYRDELLPQLEGAQDGSAGKAAELAAAQAAVADLRSRRTQTVSALNQLLGRPLDASLAFAPDPDASLAAFAGRAHTLDPVAAARDALVSRVKVAQAVEAAADKNLKVDQLRLEPISLIATSLGRLIAALSGDAGSPELIAMARQQTLDAQRALEAFDAEVPEVRARLAAQLCAANAARAALAGKTDAESRLQDLELGRQADQLLAQLDAWGGASSDAADGSLPSSYADLEDRLRRAEEVATAPAAAGGDAPAEAAPAPMALEGGERWYDAIQTLGGDPIDRRYAEGWVEARLRSPSTSPESVAMLARLRQDSADEMRRLDMASADARAELLLARLRLGAGLMRWSEGVGLGDSTRARVTSDLDEAAALLHLPESVRPESLLPLMPADGAGDLSSIAERYLKDAESLDLDALGRTLFEKGLPAQFQDQAGRGQYPELAADMIAQKMSSRGFTPIAAVGMFKGQWVSGAFLEAPHPEDIQNALTNVLDNALRRELESQDRLKSLGLLLHALMASVADKTRVVAAARLRETLARRELAGTLERVRAQMAPVSEAAAAAAEAQAAQEAFVTALYALREDFSRLTTELTALGIKPASYAMSAPPAAAGPGDDPLERTPREKLLAYWADRMQDADFERQVEALLAGQPGSVLAQLRELSARYRTAAKDADAVRDNDFTPAERLDLLTKTDVQGRRRALEEVLSGVLNGMQTSDPAHSPGWTGLMEFLRQDVSARAGSAASGLEGADAEREALRGALGDALGAPPALRAEIAKLETLQEGADAARRQALAAWLARTDGAQDHVLKDKALDAYVTALDAFDAEMQKALASKEVAADAGWARSLDALFGVRESLARRRDRLQYGRGLLTVDAAIALDETRLRALRGSPDETREIEPASESLAFLRGLRERWTGKPDAIPALVALEGADGTTDWATVEDLAKAKSRGLLTTISGRQYLAPPGAAGSAPATEADARARGWRVVVEGEDAARERLRQAREARTAAASAAALQNALETADVAVTGGGALGTGATTRTMTLAELRGLEDSGRALWFAAAPDPRTGLRAAVPSVAARWRDPSELVLALAPDGAAPPAGEFPTLEALLASPDAKSWSSGSIGAAGLRALAAEAASEALAARREGWLKLKLSAWGFALSKDGAVQAVYLGEDELRKATAAAADPKSPTHGWSFLRTDAVALGLAGDGTLVSVKVAGRTIALGEGVPTRWIQQQPLALETDVAGRVTRLFFDEKALAKDAAGWSLEDASGRTWQGGEDVPPLLRARSWTDAATGRTVALGRELLQKRRDAARSGEAGAAHWSYAPAQWPALVTEIPRGIVSTPIEIVTGRDPNQQGYLGRANARRGEGGATVARGALGAVLNHLDLFGLMNDPVDRYFDPSQYPEAVRRDRPLRPDGATDGGGMTSADGKKKVFYGVGSFRREESWAAQDQEASRAEVLAAFRGGVRRETDETVRGRAGDYMDSSVGLDVGRGAALAAIDELGARLDASGTARLSSSPRRAAVDRVDQVVQVVAGADTQDARLAVYEAALKRLQAAPPPAASDAEVADAEAALTAALAARRAANAAVAAASPAPNLPGCPVLPQLYAALSR
ncbi:MAG TPA: hypothetical protein VN915_17500 [Elusimicrobiota bacterium]|nr:hypothetical protein [Elusimicrobiota bacterium]